MRDGAAGLFLAASKFPKIRETRAPKVAELRSVADQLDPKISVLVAAPDLDPEGNPAIVKFSRKNQAQYVGLRLTRVNRLSGVGFQNGKWVEA